MAIKIRHTNRYREIAMALVRHGFGYMVEEMGLFQLLSIPKKWIWKKEPAPTKTVGERLRLVLEELGPAFVKLGQLMSTRHDLLPDEVLAELGKLQDQVPPFSYKEVREIMEEQLYRPIEEIFSEFHEEPLAAASIGQVHYARLRTGETVAVKVQRPYVDKIIERDLEILKDLTGLAERRVEWVARYQIREVVEELSKSMLAELDYSREGRNAEKIAAQFVRDPQICIPQVYWQYTTPKVLTMEYIDGIKLNHVDELMDGEIRLKEIARLLVNTILHQILVEGFFHADPHPGNVFVKGDGGIAFVDFGMVGRLTEEMKYNLSSLLISLMRRDSGGIIRAVLRLGLVSEEVDMITLRKDLDQLREQYYDIPLSQISLGQAMNQLFDIANRHRILIASDLTLLAKALFTVEGVAVKLDPELSLVQLAEPFGRRLIMERMSPKGMRKRLWRQIPEAVETFADLPNQAIQLTKLIRRGKLRMEIGLTDIEVLLRKMDHISNRISFSIVLLSFSLVMVGLIIGSSMGQDRTFLGNFPAIEIGAIVAGVMLLWLLYSIFRSGRF